VELDLVYLGHDSVMLLREAWKGLGFGRLAADLGTGNGLLATALATRFDHVVAADISSRCTASAALALAMNGHLAGRMSVVQADIATCLRPGSFDAVVANAPWVPEAVPEGGPAVRRFAAGGPTGFELPRRFLDQAATLLAPGGRAFVACTDLTFADGCRPLRDHVPALERLGVAVDVVPTALRDRVDLVAWANERVTGVTAADHVVVTLRRP
jgi:methylase of polypeptide subunit release factors